MGISWTVGDGLDLSPLLLRDRGDDFTAGGTVGNLGNFSARLRGVRTVPGLSIGLDGGRVVTSGNEREFITVRVLYDHRSPIDPEFIDRQDLLGERGGGIDLLFTAHLLSIDRAVLGVIYSIAGDGDTRSGAIGPSV